MPQYTLSGLLLLANAVCIGAVFVIVFFVLRPRREQGRPVHGPAVIAVILGAIAFAAAITNAVITFSS